jgi:hypothetical protein
MVIPRSFNVYGKNRALGEEFQGYFLFQVAEFPGKMPCFFPGKRLLQQQRFPNLKLETWNLKQPCEEFGASTFRLAAFAGIR